MTLSRHFSLARIMSPWFLFDLSPITMFMIGDSVTKCQTKAWNQTKMIDLELKLALELIFLPWNLKILFVFVEFSLCVAWSFSRAKNHVPVTCAQNQNYFPHSVTNSHFMVMPRQSHCSRRGIPHQRTRKSRIER